MKLKLAKLVDEFYLALKGLLLATRRKTFWIPFLITFIIFGTLINLLSNGFASFNLIFANIKGGNILGAFAIVKNAFLAIFGYKKAFSDWILNFFLTLIQSILIALVIIVSKHNRSEKKKETDSGLESSAIVAGLVVLGSGCPTCGTTLLTPILGTILSGASGASALAGKISGLINLLAIFLAIFIFKKLGLMVYVIIKNEQYMKKKEEKDEKDS